MLAVTAVTDERVNRDTIGAVGQHPVQAEGVRAWVAEGFRALGGDPAALAAEIGVQRLYARLVVSQMEGVVALRVTFIAPGGAGTERSYRGSATRVNWANARAEFNALLNEALAVAVAGVAADLPSLCPRT
jgi:hypothetical protein